jgi:hypothetical protein
MAVLTLHHGDAQAEYVAHPMEVARRALLAAAELEDENGRVDWPDWLRRIAASLPDRGRVTPAVTPMGVTPAPQSERAERDRREMDEIREIQERWKQITADRRESLLLHVLGDERLLIRELTVRLNDQLCPEGGKGPYGKHRAVYESNVRSLVMRMLQAGQLQRISESFKNKPRYRYFVKRALDGPIADLEQVYREGGV